MATKKKAKVATKKAPAGDITWGGALPLRVVIADGSTAMVAPGGSFTPHPDWLAAVKSRQPAKFKLLK